MGRLGLRSFAIILAVAAAAVLGPISPASANGPESDPDGDPNVTLTVSPSDNLTDGQLVQVSGAGFPPNSVGGRLRMCNTGDSRVCTAPIGTFATDASGSFAPVQVNVPQTFTADGV
ncbi:MAG: neocarzinostatin apoprotein domain-containing protein, partial [Acidimicrobiales bacterium]